ncbi:unnamed protein product, partial [Pylaiella littoralis]
NLKLSPTVSRGFKKNSIPLVVRTIGGRMVGKLLKTAQEKKRKFEEEEERKEADADAAAAAAVAVAAADSVIATGKRGRQLFHLCHLHRSHWRPLEGAGRGPRGRAVAT